VAKGAHAVLPLDRVGGIRADKLAIHAVFLSSRSPDLKPGRKHIAAFTRQLALEPGLRNLRGNRRMRRLEQADSSTRRITSCATEPISVIFKGHWDYFTAAALAL
jgi:hypothetical protein